MSESGSTLDRIRAAELAAATALADATERSEAAIAEARQESVRIAEAARAEGRALADQRLAEATADAQTEADETKRASDDRIRQLRAEVGPQLEGLVTAMLDVVLPSEETG